MKLLFRGIAVLAIVLAMILVPAHPAAACTQPWAATWTGQSTYPTLDAGDRTTLHFYFRNDGCNTWDINQGGSQAFLGTWNADPGQDKWSWLGGGINCGVSSGWYSCNRIRPVSNTVAPGATADFQFDVIGPAAPGTYKLNVRPLIENVMWMQDAGAYMLVTVRSTSGWSRYMKTVDARIPNVPNPGSPAGALYIEGCQAGGDIGAKYGGPFTPQTGFIVLDFGGAWLSGTTYGAAMFNNAFASTSQILEAGKAFAQGYWDCSPAWPKVKLAIGTNTSTGNTYVTAAHGVAWAQMAKSLNDYIVSKTWNGQIEAWGANDAEISTSWASATSVKAWACVLSGTICTGGYGSVGSGVPYVDYGDAAGCPPYGSCTPWTQDDVWFVAWGAPPAWPLPEIYNESGAQADQWYRLSLYAMTAHGHQMSILGAMTQYAACQTNGPCTGLKNTPQAGWLQLWQKLNADLTTWQSLPNETDITWAN